MFEKERKEGACHQAIWRLRYRACIRLVCLLCAFLPAFAAAQKGERLSLHLTQADGLPHNNIYCIFQDSDQLVWFGTEHGVSRYDGRIFQNLSTADGLTDNNVIDIRQDHWGRIWFLNVAGRPCFFAKGKVHNNLNTPWLKDLEMLNFCSMFHEDAFGNIYFGSASGDLLRLDSTNCVTDLTLPRDEYHLHNWILAMRSITSDSIIVATGVTFYAIFSQGMVSQHRTFRRDSTLENSNPMKGTTTHDGRMLMTWSNEMGEIEPDLSLKQHSHLVPGGTPRQILFVKESKSGDIWLGTILGAFKVPVDSLGCPPAHGILLDEQVQYILEDHEGGEWYATTNGVYYFPKLPFNTLERYRLNLPSPATTFFPISPLDFMVGLKDGSVYHYYPESGSSRQILPPSFRKDAPIILFRSISDKTTLIGSQKIVVEIEKDVVSPFGLTKISDALIVQDTVCLCTPRGLYLTDYSRRHEPFFGSEDFKTRRSVAPGRCYAIEVDSLQNLWVALKDGLYRYDFKTVTRFTPLDSLMRLGTITDLLTDRRGNLWVATDAYGVFRIHGNEIQQINEEDGLSSDETLQLALDDKGWIWVASSEGVSCIIPKNLDSKDGALKVFSFQLLGKPFRITTIGNKVFMLRTDEILAMEGSFVEKMKGSPHPVVLKINANGLDWEIGKKVNLAYGESNMTVDFTGISFQAASMLKFRYRILGSAIDWTDTDAHSISFSSFNPGSFTFELQARTMAGDWSKETASFDFEVKAPYWLRIDFLILVFLLLASSAGLIFWGVIRLVRRRADNLRRIMEAEHKALIAQMNPHFIFNSLNSIQNYFLARDIETANEYLADFSNLMRAILDSGRITKTTLGDELRLVQLYLNIERMRTDGKFDYEIDIEAGINPEQVFLPPLLLQPFLENAIWHGIGPKEGKGKIIIRFSFDPNGINCSIIDDGIGRMAAQGKRVLAGTKRRSHATSIVEERFHLLNMKRQNPFTFSIEDLHDSESRPCGTVVHFRFPQPYP